MTNKPKAKGTGGETELLRLLQLPGLVRTPASSTFDLHRPGEDMLVQALATRPDRGRWLVTVDLETFATMLPPESELEIEVKRYRRFSLHTIFEGKFGR